MFADIVADDFGLVVFSNGLLSWTIGDYVISNVCVFICLLAKYVTKRWTNFDETWPLNVHLQPINFWC